jgi:hypothetical protein
LIGAGVRRTVRIDMDWLTIEVFDAGTPATEWARAWQGSLVETALSSGAIFWDQHEHAWGVVFEFTFADESARDRFRGHPTVTAALDAAPDPVNGAYVYPHRGGGTGTRVPRRPRPPLDEGAMALPEPEPMVEVAAIGIPVGPAPGLFEVFA